MNLSQPVPSFIILFMVLLTIRQLVTLAGISFARMMTTPLITLCSCALAVTGLMRCGGGYVPILVVSALGFSLIADTVLMTGESTSLLKVGLGMFLLGHILYIIAFSSGYSFILVDIPLGVVILVLMMFIIARFRRAGRMGKMAPAVMIYVFALSLMVFFAASALFRDTSAMTIIRFTGAFAFYLSDTILGWSLFVKRIPRSTIFVWSLYAPGQFLIALSLSC